MIFKVISFCLGYVSFAKGDKKVFFLYEAVWGNLQNLILSFIGYKYWGLTGLAFSFVIHYMIYLITVFLLCSVRYKYKPSKEFILLSILGITITILLFLSTYISNTMIIIPQFFIAIIVSFFSLLRLEKHIGILNLIKSRFVRERT
jgi:PST family polysaccharide transporter